MSRKKKFGYISLEESVFLLVISTILLVGVRSASDHDSLRFAGGIAAALGHSTTAGDDARDAVEASFSDKGMPDDIH